MDQLKFNCPRELSQKFWAVCSQRDETLGATIRELMLREIDFMDPGFRDRLIKDYGDIDDIREKRVSYVRS